MSSVATKDPKTLSNKQLAELKQKHYNAYTKEVKRRKHKEIAKKNKKKLKKQKKKLL